MEEKETKQLNRITTPQSLIVFGVGFLGLDLIATIFMLIVSLFCKTNNLEDRAKLEINGYVNFLAYATILFILVLVIQLPEIKRILSGFKKLNLWARGIGYGIGLIVISTIVSLITNKLYPQTSDNQNEASLVSIIKIIPIASFAFIVVLAPICEELTYRYALFGWLYKKNKILAYGVCSLIFGIIHISLSSWPDMTKTEIINELVNLPSYMISGAYLCFVFDNEDNLGASIIAHSTNNLFAFVTTLAYSQVSFLRLIR